MDVDATAEFIARTSPQYAKGFVRQVFDMARSLTEFSERGRHVPEIDDPDVRELFLGIHRLVYKVSGNQVAILGLVHGSRDLAALWKREKR